MDAKRKRKTAFAIPIIVVVLGSLGISAKVAIDFLSVMSDYMLYQSALEDNEVIAACDEADSLSNDTAIKEYITQELYFFDDHVGTYPEIDENTFADIYKLAGDNINIDSVSLDSAAGIIVISGKAENVNDSADYAERLRKSEKYVNVTHSGYVFFESEEGEQAAAGYTFTVACLMPAQEIEVRGVE